MSLLKSNGVDSKEVTFINHPNKDELTYEIKNSSPENSQIRDGWTVVVINTT